MPRERLTFRQRDITAAIKAVKRAGHEIARIEINQDGTIIIIPVAPLDPTKQQLLNPWDELYENETA